VTFVGPGPTKRAADRLRREGHKRVLRLLIAERRALYGAAFDAAFAEEPDFRVVGVTGDGTATSDLAAALRPDVVIVDAQLPHTGGVGICARLKTAAGAPVVVIVDDAPRTDVLLDAIEAGADGYVSRDMHRQSLIRAVRAVGAGELCVPRAMVAALVRGLQDRRRELYRTVVLYDRLTRREREVLDLLADGLDHVAAAEVLVISPQTARTHIQNVLRKLEVHSRLEAAAIARQYRQLRGVGAGVA